MSRVVEVVGLALLAAILTGLFVRRRARSCVSFTLYLAAVLVTELLIVAWPERFWNQRFWLFKEAVHALLKLAIALELMSRIFGPFPSAYAAARRAMLAVVIGMAALAWMALARGTEYANLVGRLYPHLNDGTAWLFIALAGYCLWYHLPLDSLHKAVLIGLVPYLLVYSIVQRAVAALGWETTHADVFNRSAPVAYLALLAYWTVVVWPRTEGDDGTRVGRLVEARP